MYEARKGITPVVAMVLLLMMTVAAAGAFFVWTQGIIGGQQEEAQQQLNTELTARDITCDAGADSVTVTVGNSGSVAVDSSNIGVFVHTLDGTLQGQATGISVSDGSIDPSEESETISVSSWAARRPTFRRRRAMR